MFLIRLVEDCPLTSQTGGRKHLHVGHARSLRHDAIAGGRRSVSNEYKPRFDYFIGRVLLVLEPLSFNNMLATFKLIFNSCKRSYTSTVYLLTAV